MNRRIRMMCKALKCFHARRYFSVEDKQMQIVIGELCRWLRKGAKNR